MAKIPFNDQRVIRDTPVQRTPNVNQTDAILSQNSGKAQAAQMVGAGLSTIGNFVAHEFEKQKSLDVSADVANGTARLKGINERYLLEAQQLNPDGENYSERLAELDKRYESEVDQFVNGRSADGVSNLRYPEARQAIDQTRALFRVQRQEATKAFALQRSMQNTQAKIDSTQNEIIRSAGPDAEALTETLFAQMVENGMDAETARIKKTATLKAVSAKRANDFQTDIVANIDNYGNEWALGEIKAELAELRSGEGKYRHLSESERDEVEIGFDKLTQTIKASKADAAEEQEALEKKAQQRQEAAEKQFIDDTVAEHSRMILSGEADYTGAQLVGLATFKSENGDSVYVPKIADTLAKYQESVRQRRASQESRERAAQKRANEDPAAEAEFQAREREFIIKANELLADTEPWSPEYLEFIMAPENKEFVEDDFEDRYAVGKRRYDDWEKAELKRVTDLLKLTIVKDKGRIDPQDESSFQILQTGKKSSLQYDQMRGEIAPRIGSELDVWGRYRSNLTNEQVLGMITKIDELLQSKDDLQPGELDTLIANTIAPVRYEVAKMDADARIASLTFGDYQAPEARGIESEDFDFREFRAVNMESARRGPQFSTTPQAYMPPQTNAADRMEEMNEFLKRFSPTNDEIQSLLRASER